MEDMNARIIRLLRKAAGLAHNAEDAAEFGGLADEMDVVETLKAAAELSGLLDEPNPAPAPMGKKRAHKDDAP